MRETILVVTIVMVAVAEVEVVVGISARYNG